MSRIPPIALRIACNTRHYDCSGISSYYYSNQFLANLALIQNVKTLGQQLVFPMTDHKPNDSQLAILPSLFPVTSVLNSRLTWQLKLKNHKPFFNSKNIGFACAFVFDTLNNVAAMNQKMNPDFAKLSLLQKQNYEHILSSISRCQYKSKLQKNGLKYNYHFSNKPGILNLHRLKQIMAMKEFRPTHIGQVFYLACTGLINQCQAKASPMIAKKEFASSKNQLNISPALVSKLFYFESLATLGARNNRNVNDLRQTIHRGVGIPKCFISRSCDQNALLHLWHILPYDYVANVTQRPITKVHDRSIIQLNTKYSNNYSNKTPENNIDLKNQSGFNYKQTYVILFHMYDSGQNANHSTNHSTCVRF